MGEHSKPQPQYEQFDRPLLSQVPIYDLGNRDAEEVMNDEVYLDASYMTRYEMDAEDPDSLNDDGVLAANQLEWEFNLVPRQNFDRAMEFSTALFGSGLSGNSYDTKIGANVLARAIEVDEGDSATELLKEGLQHELLTPAIRDTVAEAINSGVISAEKAAKVAIVLMDQLHEANKKVSSLESTDRQLARELAKRGVTIANVKGGVFIGDDTTTRSQTFNYGTGDRKD